MNVAIVARATNFVTQYFFDTMEHTTWQYGHIPTQLWGGNKAILQQVHSWQYSHIATMFFVATITHATILLVAISMLATILRVAKPLYCNTTLKRMQEPIAPFQMQPKANDHTQMQLIHIATKIAILQPNIGVTTRLYPSSVSTLVT